MKAHRWIHALTAFCMALAFSLLIMTSNSPLFRAYGADSAIFIAIGRAIARGAVPYADIFDHKGPVIFYINALSQAVSATTFSAWMVELLFLFASLCVLRRIAGAFGTKHAWAVQMIYLVLVSRYLDGGNYTEEYCNLFTLSAIWFALGFALSENPRRRYALGMGAMFSLCIMTRLNNALPIAGLALALCAWLFFARRRMFLRHAAAFLAGVVIAALPFLLYFWAKGALSSFFESAFVHNLRYLEGEEYTRRALARAPGYGGFVASCGVCALAGLACAWRGAAKNSALRAVLVGLVCAAALGAVSTLLSRKWYEHYLLICIPATAAGAAAVIASLGRFPKAARGVLLGALALAACHSLYVYGDAQASKARKVLRQYPAYTEECQALAAHIPLEERGDVLGYRIEPKWYVASGITPARRVFFMQEHLAQVNPALMDEIVAMFEQNPPRWLVLAANRSSFTLPVDSRVQALIDRKYEREEGNQRNELWRLRDEYRLQ